MACVNDEERWAWDFWTGNPPVALQVICKVARAVVVALYLLSSASVMGRFISWSMAAFSRVCAEHRLNISGNSCPSSAQIVRRLFSPLLQMKRHLEDARRSNSLSRTSSADPEIGLLFSLATPPACLGFLPCVGTSRL